MSEIDEADDARFADAENLVEQLIGTLHRLKRAAQNHEVIALVGKIRQSFIEVRLNDRNTAAGAFNHLRLVALHAHDFAVLEFGKQTQQASGAAAEVENARAVRNHRNDGRQVIAGERGVVVETEILFCHFAAFGLTFARKFEIRRPGVSSSSRNASCPYEDLMLQ